jgi:hypothetical protein
MTVRIKSFRSWRLALLIALPLIVCLVMLVRQEFSWKQDATKLTIMQLDEVLQRIEVYKVRYKVYPNSLAAISISDPELHLHDPFQEDKYAMLQYRKIDDKYTLFSVGPDGLAGTADDVYPVIAIPDSSRIGLIKAP